MLEAAPLPGRQVSVKARAAHVWHRVTSPRADRPRARGAGGGVRLTSAAHPAARADGGRVRRHQSSPRPVPASVGRCWPASPLHPGAHPRGELAARFWPDVLDSSARASLRSAVWALRRALGPSRRGLPAGRRASRSGSRTAPRCGIDLHDVRRARRGGRELADAVELCTRRAARGVRGRVGAARPRRPPRAADRGAGARSPSRRARPATEAGRSTWTRRQAALDPLGEEAHRRPDRAARRRGTARGR